jgi:MFS family permease
MLYGLFVAVGFGALEVITLSTVARWFVRRRGMMSGIVKVGTGSGQLVLPFFAFALISAYGWRHAYIVIGSVFIIMLVAAAQVMRHTPEDMGLRPDNERHEPFRDGFNSGSSGVFLKSAVKTKQFWAITLSEFASFFCLLTIVVHIVPHSIDLGLTAKTGAGVISVIGGVSMFGRLVLGTAHDRVGGKLSLGICFFLLICSFIWLQMAREAWMLFIFALIYGFAHGGIFTVVSPLVAELFGMRSHGVLFGIVLFSGNCAGAIGPILAGRIFDITGSYRSVFLLLTMVALMGLILVTQLKPMRLKENEKNP